MCAHAFMVVTVHVHIHSTFECQISYGEEVAVDEARIIALRAQVDPNLRAEMQVFLKRVTTNCDLMHFYQTFVKCCDHVLERRNTLSRLKVCTCKL